MLSQNTIDTVKSTVPLLAEHGLEITRNFYDKLFTNNPDLQHIFNQANQNNETQARALADAVFAYASNIDNLEVLLPAVERIAHKHTSLGVSPDQYPIVGKHLLEAIQDVLNLPDGHAALTAWGEAYDLLADIFIKAEEDIYQSNEAAEGGWRGFREFVITEIATESPEVKSFYLKPKDGGAIASFKGGQYIGVKVNPDEFEYDEIRQYSLSDAPGKDYYRITTKIENPGRVSNFMHSCKANDTVLLQPPTGVFQLNPNAKRHIFVAGGVGITPVMGMLLEALQSGHKPQDIVFIQCARSAEFQLFSAELQALSNEYGFDYKVSLDEGDGGHHSGYLNKDILSEWTKGTDADVYFCGPKPFMSALNTLLLELGFAPEDIHHEIFGPTTQL